MKAGSQQGQGFGSWRELLAGSLSHPNSLKDRFGPLEDGLDEVLSRYPFRVNPYYLSLIREKGDPIYRQCMPDVLEIADERGWEDPLEEERDSPVPGLTHRYPDRVCFLVSARCPVYCRFCNRKRKVGRSAMVSPKSIQEGMAYIRGHKEVRDVLLSGGDPLLLGNRELHGILTQLRGIRHVEILRIGTRVPCTLPQRVTPALARLLRGFQPLYINTHFNHPDEMTPEASRALALLADAGLPLGCQTVLLKGVNDHEDTMRNLMHALVRNRVRPYYLFQADAVKGTAHFWTPLNQGLEIINALQGHTSGLCIPQFAVDLPGGGGKVTLLPEKRTRWENNAVVLTNYRGQDHWINRHFPA